MAETFAAFERINAGAAKPLVITCDHASNALPSGYGTLGLEAHHLDRHIAWDPGAGNVARRLSRLFDATAILCGFSRLLIDANRGDGDPTQVAAISDKTVISGNAGLADTEHERRRTLYHGPYHDAVTGEIERHIAEKRVPVVLAVHSFSPAIRGEAKPWHLGFLWDRDERLARPLVEHFSEDADVEVGDNQPYSGRIPGDSMHRHGTMRGLPHILVEFRQDLIADDSGVRAWAERVYRAIDTVIERHGEFDIVPHG